MHYETEALVYAQEIILSLFKLIFIEECKI